MTTKTTQRQTNIHVANYKQQRQSTTNYIGF